MRIANREYEIAVYLDEPRACQFTQAHKQTPRISFT